MAYGFYFNMQRCIGCRTCQVACKDRHDMHACGPRPRRVDTFECGEYPDAALFHHVMSCNHCENPACVANCPTTAMYKDASGIVLHDDGKCVQCRMCMAACPYGAPQFDEVTSMIVKCDSCIDLRAADMQPVCVAACPMRALDFGDMDELRAKYGDDAVSELPYLPSAAYTSPNVLVTPAAAALREGAQAVTL
ncbi:4Fe-4S dicluster domain-containing protein [Adlercreutzia sp. ZJ473]|uniref:4Fe-4S dicluster domain-containing protein n=1 Tax=Adlercreutzia sp. ZJ473 TaxID=2722822 RepID=UPI001556F9EA|nr:4Fe-4S dicluster domain-containing protein [Adlercreutzia sp. ZJ473]